MVNKKMEESIFW